MQVPTAAHSTTSLFYFAAVLCTAVDRSALRFVRLSCRNGVDWMGRRRPARGSAGTLICTHPLKDRPAIGGVLASIAYSTRFAPHRRSPRWRDRTTPPKATVEPRCHGCGPKRLATPVPWTFHAEPPDAAKRSDRRTGQRLQRPLLSVHSWSARPTATISKYRRSVGSPFDMKVTSQRNPSAPSS